MLSAFEPTYGEDNVTHSHDVMCAGEALVMVTPNEGGRLDTHSTFVLRPGGSESNVASLMSALGHRSAWASQLGTDPLGDIVIEGLTGAGVDISMVRRLSGFRTGTYFKDPHESGTDVYYYRVGSAAAQMTASTIAAWDAVKPGLLHLSGITPALSTGCRELTRALIHSRTIAGATLSFDVNYRASLWPITEAAPELLALAQASDIVFVGRDEAEALWGTRTAEEVRNLIDKPAHLVVKDSDIEAVSYSGDTMTRVPSPTVQVVEAVGAGDAFAAGWLSGFLRQSDATTRLRLGHLIAAHVLQSPTDSAELPEHSTIEKIVSIDPTEWNTSMTRVAVTRVER
jgi:2-dehydro-3-deoxygluconokinase